MPSVSDEAVETGWVRRGRRGSSRSGGCGGPGVRIPAWFVRLQSNFECSTVSSLVEVTAS